MKLVSSFFYSLFFLHILSAQEIKQGDVYYYARKIVDTMASEIMHGRGYVMDGNKIAANYIKTEFQKSALKSFTENYYQPFSFPVNTFPGNVSVKIDGKDLVAGKDYIVGEQSGTQKGKFSIKKQFSQNGVSIEIPKTYKNACAIITDKKKKINNYSNAPVVYLEMEKLTQDIAGGCLPYASIHMLESALPKEAKGIEFDIKNKIIKKFPSQNVVAYVKGTIYPDSFIVFTAHYDHLGMMGKTVYFPGANDNASGCAMLLNLAKHFSQQENQPKYSIAFIAFSGEELGLLGSKYFTEHPLFPLKNITFLLNMDIMGTGEEGITVVNGSVFKNEFDKLKKINTKNNYIKDVKMRGKAANSDHYFFTEAGVKSFFIYTMGGIKAYHDVYDRAETLPLNEFENLFLLITEFEKELEKSN